MGRRAGGLGWQRSTGAYFAQHFSFHLPLLSLSLSSSPLLSSPFLSSSPSVRGRQACREAGRQADKEDESQTGRRIRGPRGSDLKRNVEETERAEDRRQVFLFLAVRFMRIPRRASPGVEKSPQTHQRGSLFIQLMLQNQSCALKKKPTLTQS